MQMIDLIQLQAIKTGEKKEDRRILSTRLYREFMHAFSDAVNGDSELHAYLEEIGLGVNAGKPERIYAGGVMKNGYDDDFHIRYPNGVVIVIGKACVEDIGDKEDEK